MEKGRQKTLDLLEINFLNGTINRHEKLIDNTKVVINHDQKKCSSLIYRLEHF